MISQKAIEQVNYETFTSIKDIAKGIDSNTGAALNHLICGAKRIDAGIEYRTDGGSNSYRLTKGPHSDKMVCRDTVKKSKITEDQFKACCEKLGNRAFELASTLYELRGSYSTFDLVARLTNYDRSRVAAAIKCLERCGLYVHYRKSHFQRELKLVGVLKEKPNKKQVKAKLSKQDSLINSVFC